MPVTSSSPSAVLRAVAAVELPSRRLSSTESITLLQALRVVADPGKRRGRRPGLQSVLLLALGAVMAAARSYAAIVDWAAVADHPVAGCGRPPHASTFRRLLGRWDVAALEAAVGWVLSRREAAAAAAAAGGGPVAERRQVLAVDGKTLRGARGGQAKLVCVYDHAHQLVLT